MNVKLKEILTRPLSRFSIYTFLFLYGVAGCSLLALGPDIMNKRLSAVPNLPSLINKLEYSVYGNEDAAVRLSTAGEFVCTGVVVSQYYVITAAHCVDDLRQEFVIEDSTKQQKYVGNVVGIYDAQDIALIYTDVHNGIRPAKADFDGTTTTAIEVPVITCGYPKGQKKKLCIRAVLSGNYFFLRRGVGLLYTGMSGGPVYHDNPPYYTLIGVNSSVTQADILVGPITSLPDIFNVEVEE